MRTTDRQPGWRAIPCLALVCGSLIIAACGASPTGTAGNTTTKPATATTATPKHKPTSLPTIDLSFCQSLLSVVEANQFMHPATPATNIRIDTSPAGGSCNYEYAPYKSTVTVLFLPYAGPKPVTEQQFGAFATQMAAQSGATVFSSVPVSGAGDAAIFVAAGGNADGITIKQDTLYVVYGSVLIAFGNFSPGSSLDATQQGYLTQVATLVVSRL